MTRRPGIGALVFAWTGAALFLLSLLVFVFLYLYGIVFRPAPDGSAPLPAAVADIALFSVFALHHSLFARARVKRAVTRILPSCLERSAFTWMASLLFLIVCLAWQPVDGTVYALRGGLRVIGFAVQAAGVTLTLAGSSAIDILNLAGVRPVLLARSGRTSAHASLKVDGVYGVVRHPLYFGWALFVFGAPDMNATRLLFAIVSTAYLAVAIPFEERSLVDAFGDRYRDYQRTTKWRLVPGIW
ncbi:MAG: isoprenylcysteine carboxylmethyltransferase family protein [Acidobacteria bacterium]|nr:isoprenylcysteine carboxylmethyltransferase family protein [Acidobacteriota bacterium]